MFEDYNSFKENFKNGLVKPVKPDWKKNSYGIKDYSVAPKNVVKIVFNSPKYLEASKLSSFELEPGMVFVIKDISIESKIKTGLYKEFVVDKNYRNVILFRELEDNSRRMSLSKVDILIDLVSLYVTK